MLDDSRNILPVRCQLANLEPDKDVDFGVDVGRAGRRKSPEFTGTDRLGDGYGRRQHAPRRLPDRALQLGVLVQRMLLIVTEHLEHYRLGLDVFDERFRARHRYLEI